MCKQNKLRKRRIDLFEQILFVMISHWYWVALIDTLWNGCSLMFIEDINSYFWIKVNQRDSPGVNDSIIDYIHHLIKYLFFT